MFSPLDEIVPKNDVVGQDVDGGCLSGVNSVSSKRETHGCKELGLKSASR